MQKRQSQKTATCRALRVGSSVHVFAGPRQRGGIGQAAVLDDVREGIRLPQRGDRGCRGWDSQGGGWHVPTGVLIVHRVACTERVGVESALPEGAPAIGY